MNSNKQPRPRELSEVEHLVMDHIWARGHVTAESCREALSFLHPMKDSTIRTVFRRLERKGYLVHEVHGRTFLYKARDARQNVAIRAVKKIIDRFCGGSAEELVLGMVDNSILDRKQLQRLAQKIDRSESKNARKQHPQESQE